MPNSRRRKRRTCSMFRVRIFEERIQPLASPGFVEQHHIETPEDLLHVPLIQSVVNVVQWGGWFRSRRVEYAPGRFAYRFDRTSMALDAAVQGLGVGSTARPSAPTICTKAACARCSTSAGASRCRRTFWCARRGICSAAKWRTSSNGCARMQWMRRVRGCGVRQPEPTQLSTLEPSDETGPDIAAAVCCLVEEGTIAAAAEREHLAAPAVSKCIGQLEYSLRTQLLKRTHKGFDPTAARLALVNLARRAVSCLDDRHVPAAEPCYIHQ
jgi:DNA-binding transcriptional LysR family regulator